MLIIKKRWLLIAYLLISSAVQADDWQPVGSPGFSAGEVNYTSTAFLK